MFSKKTKKHSKIETLDLRRSFPVETMSEVDPNGHIVIPELFPITEAILKTGRTKLRCATMDSNPPKVKHTYEGMVAEKTVPAKLGESWNLISSKVSKGRHLPVIDLDVPARLIESSTPGHYHLYIDKEISTDQYLAILHAMTRAGIVEKGWYEAVMAREQGCVRPPHLKKADYYDLLLKGLNNMSKEGNNV